MLRPILVKFCNSKVKKENLKCFQRRNKQRDYLQRKETDIIIKRLKYWLSNSNGIVS